MRRIIFPLLTLVLSQLVIQGQVKLENLRVEHLSDPLGLDILQPRFGWQLVCEKRNVMQSAYQIRVGADVHSLDNGKNLIWSTGKVASDSSVNVAYS